MCGPLLPHAARYCCCFLDHPISEPRHPPNHPPALRYFIKLVKRKYKKDVSTDARALQKLRREAERAKRALSSQHQVRCAACWRMLLAGSRACDDRLCRS